MAQYVHISIELPVPIQINLQINLHTLYSRSSVSTRNLFQDPQQILKSIDNEIRGRMLYLCKAYLEAMLNPLEIAHGFPAS